MSLSSSFNLVSPSKEVIKLYPIDSGISYINKLFYYYDLSDNKLKVLGGYPAEALINITGEADTGKSLLCQIAIVANAAKKIKCLYISVENPDRYVSQSLQRISSLKKIDYSLITENVKIIDLSGRFYLSSKSDHQDSANIDNFFKNLYGVCKNFKVCVFDSVTGLYENKEVMARYIVRRIFKLCKDLRITCFMISQKREDSPFSSKSAGGMAISHIADCNIILSKITINSFTEQKIYGAQIGEVVRIFRIDGCRVCGHSSKNHFYKINQFGYIEFRETTNQNNKQSP